ncbi:aldehyde dehydrogenase family protein [Bradyrhizobium yuanmingense]|uniref:aldehyde dehydrogenase family protein n=1 Tax=Bradyrhizobium yuanmingense TaxID=108015 RepID=UPI0023EA5260|nr:aldehyde dehydrogenase family protein [Bradyrhizobium yuanmingense]
MSIGQAEGAKLVAGGELLKRELPGFYLAPALLTHVSNEMRVAREEIFGPVATVIRAKDYDEALELANDTPFGLSSGICTSSLKYANHFKRNAEAGMVMVNLADGRGGLPRAVRGPQRLQLWFARAGPLRTRVLYDGEDVLHFRRQCSLNVQAKSRV